LEIQTPKKLMVDPQPKIMTDQKDVLGKRARLLPDSDES